MRTLSVLNKLFTMAIIFSMINLNIAINIEQARFNISSTQAYAQAPEDPAPEGEPERDPQQSSSGGSMESQEVRSNDGTVVLENTQETDTDAITQKRKEMSGTYNKEDSSGLLGIFNNQLIAPLILLGIAYLVSQIWTVFQPSKPLDVWFAAGGAAILLAQELMSSFKQTEALKDRKSKIEYEGLGEDGTVDISQKQMIEEEKQALEEIKDTAESKSKYQKAAAAAFATASGIALINGNTEFIQAQSCAAALNARVSALAAVSAASAACFNASKAASAPVASACEAAAVTTENIEALKIVPAESMSQYNTLQALLGTKESEKEICNLTGEKVSAMSLTECEGKLEAALAATPVSTALVAKLKIAFADHAAANTALTATLAPVESACLIHTATTEKNSGAMVKKGSVSVDKSSKSYFYALILKWFVSKAHAGTGGMIGGLLGLIGAYLVPIGSAMDAFAFSSKKRGYLWLLMSGTSLGSAMAMDKEAENAEENIKKLEAILKKFKSAQAVTKVATRNLSKKTTRFAAYQPQKIGTELECVGGLPKIRTNNGSKACPSPEKYLVEGSRELSNVGFSVPDGFTGAMVDATNGLNGVDTVSPKTQHAIDVMGRNAEAIHKKAAQALKKTIDKMDKKNKKRSANLLASLGNKFGKLNKKAGGKGGLMSALPYLSQPPKQDGEENGDETAGQQDGLAAKAKGGSGIGKYKAPKAEKFKFDFGADDAQAYAAQKHAEFDETAQAVANMEETPDGEIIEDKSVDIWKVISVRYKKTAYDRLLKRIE
ncbi:hypothetical protein [Halobacteriovorax sp. DPLXC-1]|uniref:hypothetical protein n=1 Tax=Halobacteriovorax sp. DPLXC-1 TaxID=3110771 RepID=UPI002FF00E6C